MVRTVICSCILALLGSVAVRGADIEFVSARTAVTGVQVQDGIVLPIQTVIENRVSISSGGRGGGGESPLKDINDAWARRAAKASSEAEAWRPPAKLGIGPSSRVLSLGAKDITMVGKVRRNEEGQLVLSALCGGAEREFLLADAGPVRKHLDDGEDVTRRLVVIGELPNRDAETLRVKSCYAAPGSSAQ